MNFIGIDPGKSGGIAILGEAVRTYQLSKLTDRDVLDILMEYRGSHCVVESVHATPQMGKTSAFSFGRSYGMIRMAALASMLIIHDESPQAWQKFHKLKKVGGGFGKNDSEKKRRNKAKAQELFPEFKLTHAIADALLIAEYCRRTYGGNGE